MAKSKKQVRRYVAYRVGKKSNKVLECKALKKEHMARNFVSYWNSLKGVRAFVALHVVELDRFGQAQVLSSTEITW